MSFVNDSELNDAPNENRTPFINPVIVFNDDKVEQSNSSEERNETELNIRKKDSLMKLARLTETIPERASTNSLVKKNMLNEHQEEILFETGLKLTLNP